MKHLAAFALIAFTAMGSWTLAESPDSPDPTEPRIPGKGATMSGESAEELLTSVEDRLFSLASRWERDELVSAEIAFVRRSLKRQLAKARAAGVEGDGGFETRLFLLEAQVGLFPGPGPKQGPDAVERGGGAIFGRVVDEVTQEGIVGARLRVYTSEGYLRGDDSSGVDGYYSLGGLASGTYRVTVSMDGYVGELWDDLLCYPYCDPTVGPPIGVVNGTPASGIDFELVATGSMSGVFEEDNTGNTIDGYLEFWSLAGAYLFEEYARGEYIIENLAPGNYFISSDSYGSFVDELYDDLPCENGPPMGCDPTTGTLVAIVSGETADGIDFKLPLSSMGRITGSVTDSSSGAPINDYSADVVAYDEFGNIVAYAYVYGGVYEIDGLEPGEYVLWAGGESGYSSELWQEIPCEAPCDISLGTPVVVVYQETTENINFTLDPPGTFSGQVTDEVGIPILGVQITVSGGSYISATTDIDGGFLISGVKANVDHSLVARSSYHQDELWEDVPCEEACDPSLGTPIAVAPNEVTTGLNFALTRSGAIAGAISVDPTGTLLDNTYVRLYDAMGQNVGYGYSNELGEYWIYDVGPGPHYLVASRFQFLPELFEEIDCSGGCDPTTGTPITAGAGTLTEVDFALTRLGRVEGRVTSILTGQPLQYCQVRAESPSSSNSDSTDFDGHFELNDLIAETYVVTAYDCAGLEGRIYDDVYCPGGSCSLSEATPITVDLNELVTGIDFTLGPLILFLDGFESGDTAAWSP